MITKLGSTSMIIRSSIRKAKRMWWHMLSLANMRGKVLSFPYPNLCLISTPNPTKDGWLKIMCFNSSKGLKRIPIDLSATLGSKIPFSINDTFFIVHKFTLKNMVEKSCIHLSLWITLDFKKPINMLSALSFGKA